MAIYTRTGRQIEVITAYLRYSTGDYVKVRFVDGGKGQYRVNSLNATYDGEILNAIKGYQEHQLREPLKAVDLASDPAYAAAPETPVCGEAPYPRSEHWTDPVNRSALEVVAHHQQRMIDQFGDKYPADSKCHHRIAMLQEAQEHVSTAMDVLKTVADTMSSGLNRLSTYNCHAELMSSKSHIMSLIEALESGED